MRKRMSWMMIVALLTVSMQIGDFGEIFAADGTGTAVFTAVTEAVSFSEWNITICGMTQDGDWDYYLEDDYECSLAINGESYTVTVNGLDYNRYSYYYIGLMDDDYLFMEKFTQSGQIKSQSTNDLEAYEIKDYPPNMVSECKFRVYLQGESSDENYSIARFRSVSGNYLYLPPNDYTFCVTGFVESAKIANYIFVYDANASNVIDIGHQAICDLDIQLPSSINNEDIDFDYAGVVGFNENVHTFSSAEFHNPTATAEVINMSSETNAIIVFTDYGNFEYEYDRDIEETIGSSYTFKVGETVVGEIYENSLSQSHIYEIEDIVRFTDNYNNDVEIEYDDSQIYELVWKQGNTTILTTYYEDIDDDVVLPSAQGTYTLNVTVDMGVYGQANLSENVTVSDGGSSTVTTDLDRNGVVEREDLSLMVSDYGEEHSAYDLVGGFIVDILDIITVARDID